MLDRNQATLIEYLKKLTKEEINIAVQKINNRPRKCLNWKTPQEEFWGESSVLHLI